LEKKRFVEQISKMVLFNSSNDDGFSRSNFNMVSTLSKMDWSESLFSVDRIRSFGLIGGGGGGCAAFLHHCGCALPRLAFKLV
jgi:hypothetical protein